MTVGSTLHVYTYIRMICVRVYYNARIAVLLLRQKDLKTSGQFNVSHVYVWPNYNDIVIVYARTPRLYRTAQK